MALPQRLSRRSALALFLGSVLALHVALLAWSGWRHSPVVSEVGHLPAGLSHLYLFRFDLFRVNPPLVRTVAALPVALTGPSTNWTRYDRNPLRRAWSAVGVDFFYANGSRSFWLVTMARWACIPFSLIGAYVCFRWAGELYGVLAGSLALVLWCFSPYVLGHASLITPDAHAAAMGLAAAYTYWLWLRDPSWSRNMVAGVVLGLAELTKFTLVVFYPVWVVIWIAYRLPDHRNLRPRNWFGEAGMLSSAMLLSVVVINLGYGFEGSFQRLGEYRFQSRTLTGVGPTQSAPDNGANRFAGTCVSSLPVPLPKNYLQGIDTQKWDFERKIPSYLRGQWRKGGWWYFYLYALAIKVPLGTWILVVLAILLSLFGREYSASPRNEAVLLLPLLAILTFVSCQTGFTLHSRYLIPILPFVFVWVSKVARSVKLQQPTIAVIAGLAISWSVASSLWVYPHNLSYFNELVGGPACGHAHLLDSNIGWGQDFLYLKRWMQYHPRARPLHLAAYGNLAARLAGIEYAAQGRGCPCATEESAATSENLCLQPGWYAIDVNHLHAVQGQTGGAWEGAEEPSGDRCEYVCFRRSQPVAMAGYSIHIYHITLDDANRVRRELGLPELSGSSRRGSEGRE